MGRDIQLYIFMLLFCMKLITACPDGGCRELAFPSFFFFANKRLVNHSITTVKVRDMNACELRCYNEPNCVSINFNYTASAKGTYRCDLNNATHRGHDEEFVDTEGYLYRGADSACDRAHCDNGGTCQSGFTDKGYRCLCPPGFMFAHCKQDVNECASGTHNCGHYALCNNTQGSFDCICKQGYTGDGYNCTDIDECVSETHNGSNHTMCKNTKGGFNCTCKAGFTGDGQNCTDVDECEEGKHNCSANAVCNNANGSYNCTCRPAYSGNGQNCTDIDECATGTHNCSNDAVCNNTKGGFNCMCKARFTGDGQHCIDGIVASHILWGLDSKYRNELNSYLKPVLQSSSRSRFVRCWHAKTDGWAASTFHSNCDEKGPTVTIIQVGNYIFGGYTDVSWSNSCVKASSSKSFIFSLYNINGYAPVKLRIKSGWTRFAIYGCFMFGPMFSLKDIRISDNAGRNRDSFTECGWAYPLPLGYSSSGRSCTFYAGSYKFTPTDIEVLYETTT